MSPFWSGSKNRGHKQSSTPSTQDTETDLDCVIDDFLHSPAFRRDKSSVALLQLVEHGINTRCIHTLVPCLFQLPCLHTLNLSGNLLNDSSCEILAKAVVHHCSLEVLLLGANSIGHQGAATIAKHFFPDKNSTFKAEDADMVQSPPANGRRRILSPLSRQPCHGTTRHLERVYFLDLSHNPIGPKGVFAVAETVKCNGCLAYLDLRDVECDLSAAFSLLAALPFIRGLTISSNPDIFTGTKEADLFIKNLTKAATDYRLLELEWGGLYHKNPLSCFSEGSQELQKFPPLALRMGQTYPAHSQGTVQMYRSLMSVLSSHSEKSPRKKDQSPIFPDLRFQLPLALPFSQTSSIVSLVLSNCGLEDVDTMIRKLPVKLRELNLSFNALRGVPFYRLFAQCKSLVSLDLSHNPLNFESSMSDGEEGDAGDAAPSLDFSQLLVDSRDGDPTPLKCFRISCCGLDDHHFLSFADTIERLFAVEKSTLVDVTTDDTQQGSPESCLSDKASCVTDGTSDKEIDFRRPTSDGRSERKSYPRSTSISNVNIHQLSLSDVRPGDSNVRYRKLLMNAAGSENRMESLAVQLGLLPLVPYAAAGKATRVSKGLIALDISGNAMSKETATRFSWALRLMSTLQDLDVTGCSHETDGLAPFQTIGGSSSQESIGSSAATPGEHLALSVESSPASFQRSQPVFVNTVRIAGLPPAREEFVIATSRSISCTEDVPIDSPKSVREHLHRPERTSLETPELAVEYNLDSDAISLKTEEPITNNMLSSHSSSSECSWDESL